MHLNDLKHVFFNKILIFRPAENKKIPILIIKLYPIILNIKTSAILLTHMFFFIFFFI